MADDCVEGSERIACRPHRRRRLEDVRGATRVPSVSREIEGHHAIPFLHQRVHKPGELGAVAAPAMDQENGRSRSPGEAAQHLSLARERERLGRLQNLSGGGMQSRPGSGPGPQAESQVHRPIRGHPLDQGHDAADRAGHEASPMRRNSTNDRAFMLTTTGSGRDRHARAS